MAFVAIYDACVLYPLTLRGILIRIASKGLVQARWTVEIIDETIRNIRTKRSHLTDEQVAGIRRFLEEEALPDCLVRGYEPLMDGLHLPDVDDRHVFAAAIRANAQTIVTFNLDDFPRDVLTPFGIEAQHPDDFIMHQLGLDPGAVIGSVQQQAAAYKKPTMTVEQVLDHLEQRGLTQAVTELRRLLPR
jgi:hypothetical protein